MQIKNVIIGLLAASSMALTGCGDDGGGGSACEGSYTKTISFNVDCVNPIDQSALLIPVVVTATLPSQPSAGDTFEICVDASATLDDGIAQLIVDVSGDNPAEVDLTSFEGDAAVTNGSPATFGLTLGDLPQTINFDPDMDGVGNGLTIDFDPTRARITSDGSATVGVALESFSVGLGGVPVLGDLVIDIPAGAMPVVSCALPDPLPFVVLDML